MDRRSYLAGAGTVLSVAVAGCSGMLDGADPEQAQEHIDNAEELLNENADDVGAVAGTFQSDEEPPSSFESSGVETKFEQMESELGLAEEVATEEQLSYVEQLRNIGAYQVEVASFLQEFVALNSKFDTIIAYVEADRYEDAIDGFDEIESLFESSNAELTDVREALDAVDTSVLGETDRIDFENRDEVLTKLGDRLELLETFTAGYRPMVEGMLDFVPALEAYQNEQYQDAVDGLSKAEEHFSTAADEMRKLEDADSDLVGIEADLVRLVCLTDALAEGTGQFRESAQAALEGDSQLALQKAEEANQAFTGCGTSV